VSVPRRAPAVFPVTFTIPIRSLSVLLAVVAGASAWGTARASAADYVPGEVVVAFAPGRVARLAAALDRRAGGRATVATPAPRVVVLRLARGVSVAQAVARLRGKAGIAYAVPNFIAHAAGSFIPNDRGRSHRPGGWEAMQWNFLPGFGVNAPVAWANLIADGRPGGRGAVVAILDTGVAYRDWRRYRRSPDFNGTRFTAPYDFVAHNRFPLDREGHGTFVAGTVAEATNNGLALTGLAYGATIMPIRVLGADGSGDAATIAAGIRYAVRNGAQVINLSLEFPDPDTSSADIPEIISAVGYAHQHGVVVVAAAGNEGINQLAYPARESAVISVGATTRDRCLAYYSNGGSGLDLVAPGGGEDSSTMQDPSCHPNRQLPTIYQLTMLDGDPRRFGYPDGIYGTSMSSPHVAATAALVIASGVLGRHPTPDQVRARLESTAQHLGGSTPNQNYGYGLIDAGAATAPTASPARR
jgi:serine protease